MGAHISYAHVSLPEARTMLKAFLNGDDCDFSILPLEQTNKTFRSSLFGICPRRARREFLPSSFTFFVCSAYGSSTSSSFQQPPSEKYAPKETVFTI